MTGLIRSILCLSLLLAPLSALALFDKKSVSEEREELQQARSAAMDKLYKEKPAARDEIRKAKGLPVAGPMACSEISA